MILTNQTLPQNLKWKLAVPVFKIELVTMMGEGYHFSIHIGMNVSASLS